MRVMYPFYSTIAVLDMSSNPRVVSAKGVSWWEGENSFVAFLFCFNVGRRPQ